MSLAGSLTRGWQLAGLLPAPPKAEKTTFRLGFSTVDPPGRGQPGTQKVETWLRKICSSADPLHRSGEPARGRSSPPPHQQLCPDSSCKLILAAPAARRAGTPTSPLAGKPPHLPPSTALPTSFSAVTLAGTLFGVLRKKEVFAVKKQSSRSSSKLQYPLLMLLPMVIEAQQRREAERAEGSPGDRPPSAVPAPAPAPAASPLSHPQLAGAYLQ